MSVIFDIWKSKDERVNSFLQNYPKIPELLNSIFETPRILISVAQKSDLSTEQTVLLQLWRTVYDYQEDSLFLLICRRFDAGFALLRMAAELARDIARMAEDSANYAMWQSKDKIKSEEYYRQTFRFDKKNPAEKFVWDQYNIFTNFGIHGHLTSVSHLEKVGETEDGEYALLSIPDAAVVRSIGLWMAAYLPVHQVCQSAFRKQISETDPKLLDLVESMQVSFVPDIKALCSHKD
jgi:hypothetical protein